jgi:hypothetical protein
VASGSAKKRLRSTLGTRHRAFVNDHPRRSEPVPQHAEAEGEKRFLHGHEDLSALLQRRMDPLSLLVAVDRDRM